MEVRSIDSGGTPTDSILAQYDYLTGVNPAELPGRSTAGVRVKFAPGIQAGFSVAGRLVTGVAENGSEIWVEVPSHMEDGQAVLVEEVVQYDSLAKLDLGEYGCSSR
ncbi:hypothetical protein GCM10009638_12990 [Luteococcus sanguinis]